MGSPITCTTASVSGQNAVSNPVDYADYRVVYTELPLVESADIGLLTLFERCGATLWG